MEGSTTTAGKADMKFHPRERTYYIHKSTSEVFLLKVCHLNSSKQRYLV
jgi:hypothetical protein